MVSSSPETFDELGGEHLILKHVIVLWMKVSCFVVRQRTFDSLSNANFMRCFW